MPFCARTATRKKSLFQNRHQKRSQPDMSKKLSRLVGKPTMWFPNGSNTNQAVQAQKMARSLKFWIYVEEELYYPRSENKGADQVTAKLICVFVFAYADCWFSHGAAQMLTRTFRVKSNKQLINS